VNAVVLSPLSVLPNLAHLVSTGPLASTVAAASLAAMVIGAVGTIRSGRWLPRVLLMAGAMLWPLPAHVLQGPVLLRVSPLHGVHAADLLSILALGLAALRRPVRGHRRTRSDAPSAGQGR